VRHSGEVDEDQILWSPISQKNERKACGFSNVIVNGIAFGTNITYSI
jgi:hypothetical protein